MSVRDRIRAVSITLAANLNGDCAQDNPIRIDVTLSDGAGYVN